MKSYNGSLFGMNYSKGNEKNNSSLLEMTLTVMSKLRVKMGNQRKLRY